MSDELVERLLDWPYQGETMAHEAADRIEALTAERDEAWAYMSALQGDLYDAIMIKAERDRMQEALAMIDAIDPEHHIDGCALPVVRGLVLRMGETARAALKGESQ